MARFAQSTSKRLGVAGLGALAFGVVTLLVPSAALGLLIVLFAGWATANGILEIAEGANVAEHNGRSWPYAVSGVVSLVAALIAIVLPAPTLVWFALLAGAAIVLSGVMELAATIELGDLVEHRGWVTLAAILEIVAGTVFLAMPLLGIAVSVVVIGVDAVVLGIGLLVASFRVRSVSSDIKAAQAAAA